MKPINAYMNLKKFSSTVEVIDTSLRIKKGNDRLLAVRDLLVTTETLKMTEVLKTLTECFKKKSADNSNTSEIKEMFKTWEELLFDRTEAVKSLLSFSMSVKGMIDLQLSHIVGGMENSQRKSLQQALSHMLKGVEIYVDDLKCMKHAVDIMETFVIPEMSKEELQIGIEIEEISLN